MQEQLQEQPPQPPVQQKTPQQLLEEQKQRLQEERIKEQQRVRAEEEARIKRQQDIKKLDEALKGALSTLSKTPNNRSVAYAKLSLAQKQIEKLFPSILKYNQIRYLDLNTNAISDISIITQFPDLVWINLSKNQVGDLKCFNQKSLQSLQFVNLSTNKIKALTQISLPSLRRLNLTQNQITTISEWTGHPTIQILELRKNKLKKLKGLTNLKNLKQLYVCENQITDIRGLETVPNLTKISFRNNKITTFLSPFPYMPALKHINLRQNQISSLKQIGKIDSHIYSINFMANPLTQQLGQNVKRQVIFMFPYYQRVNKSDVTIQDRIQFEKQWLERQAEKQRERLQKQAQEQQARKLAQEQQAKKLAQEQQARKLAQQQQVKPEEPQQ